MEEDCGLWCPRVSNPHSTGYVTFDLTVLQFPHLLVWFSLHGPVRWREIVLVKTWARLAHNSHSVKVRYGHSLLQLPSWCDFFFFFLEWAGDKNLLGSSTFLAPLNWVGQVACFLLVTGKMKVKKRLPSPLVFTVVFRLLWEHLMEKLRFQWNAHLLLTVE